MQDIFLALASVVQLYSFLCVIYILLSWVPDLRFSSVGRFLSALCEPFLNLFRRFRFTRIGPVDFSHILALGALSVVSMTLNRLARTGTFSAGYILAAIVQILWSFFSFLLTLLLLFLLVRVIYDFTSGRKMRSDFWIMLDNFLNPVIRYVSQLFFRNRNVLYRTRLLVTFCAVLIVRLGMEIAVQRLTLLALSLPV